MPNNLSFGVASLLLMALPAAALSAQAGQPAIERGSEPEPQTAAEANAQAAPGPPTTRVERSSDPSLPDTIITTYPGNLTPPPPSAFNKHYPVCTTTVQDSCQNPGEDRAADRSQALDGTPRTPASERD